MKNKGKKVIIIEEVILENQSKNNSLEIYLSKIWKNVFQKKTFLKNGVELENQKAQKISVRFDHRCDKKAESLSDQNNISIY